MELMEEPKDRVRFCDSCNGVIGWYAAHCDICGAQLGENTTGRGAGISNQAPIAQDNEADLFRAQMRLLHRFREQSTLLVKAVDQQVREVEKVLSSGRTKHARRGQ